MAFNTTDKSLLEVHESIDTTIKTGGWRKRFSFLGPAYLVSVGYMDPGNWATDLAGGSKFGYSLIWVLLMSNLMALLLQGFSARLGLVRGRDLAQANREFFPRAINFILYILAEIAIAACDLAEVLGMAIGIQLLTGLPLIWGVSITILDTFLILYLQKQGMRRLEAFILALVAVIFISFLIQLVVAKPDPSEIVAGFIPSLPNDEALYIAIGIIGATVMPHNLYLHSALVQSRKIDRTEFGIKQAITDLPLGNFRLLDFNTVHGRQAATLWNALGGRDETDARAVVRDDVKLMAQAAHEDIAFILTEDASTLHKYCERLRAGGHLQTRALMLKDGFDAGVLREDGQTDWVGNPGSL